MSYLVWNQFDIQIDVSGGDRHLAIKGLPDPPFPCFPIKPTSITLLEVHQENAV